MGNGVECGAVLYDLFNGESNEPCGTLKLEIIFKQLTEEMIGNASSQNMTRDLFDSFSKHSFFQKSSSKMIQTSLGSQLHIPKNQVTPSKNQSVLSP